MPVGHFSDSAGKKYHLGNAAKVIAASMTAGKLPLDENHSTQRAPTYGASSPAMGWIAELRSRADGIWARVDWNQSGTKMMTDRAYKNISPVFGHDKSGEVQVILSAALTNNPGLKQLTALLTDTTNGNDMDKLAICTALGIAETVADTDVLVALQTQRDTNTRLTAEVASLKSTMVPAEQVIALQTRLDGMQADTRRAAAVAFVDGAIKAGKPITSVRDQMIAMHVADQEAAEKLVGGLVSLNSGGGGGGSGGGEPDELASMTASDIAVCTKMGITPKAFLANRKKMATSEGSAA